MSLFPLCLFVGDFTCLEKEPKDFSSCVFSSGLFVVHDASWGCQNDESELSGREKVVLPLLQILQLHIKPWADDATLVQPPCEIDYNFPGSVIINDLKFANVTMLHHHSQKAHYDFRAGPEENLAFSTFLSIIDAFQRISENVHAHHDACGGTL